MHTCTVTRYLPTERPHCVDSLNILGDISLPNFSLSILHNLHTKHFSLFCHCKLKESYLPDLSLLRSQCSGRYTIYIYSFVKTRVLVTCAVWAALPTPGVHVSVGAGAAAAGLVSMDEASRRAATAPPCCCSSRPRGLLCHATHVPLTDRYININ